MTTVGVTPTVHYPGRLEYLRTQGFDITVVCAPGEFDAVIRARGLRLHSIPMLRAIAPGRDLLALWRIWRFLRRERFDILEVATPKAALLGAVAGRLARVPCLINLLLGLAYEGQRGLARHLVRWSTAVPCRLADQTFTLTPSVREQAHQDGVCARGRLGILGSGSCNGIDLERFTPERRQLGPEVRARYGIPGDAVVAGFVGRMARDKGIVELATAFRAVSARLPRLWLLLIGGIDDRDPPPAEVTSFLAEHPRVRTVDWQSDAVPGYAAMDIFVLPTHREGQGTVLLEAGAMGLPAITTNATGARDAVQDGVTGIRVPVGDAEQLAVAIEKLSGDADLRCQMGAAGRRWVAENFDQWRLCALYCEAYQGLARKRRRLGRSADREPSGGGA